MTATAPTRLATADHAVARERAIEWLRIHPWLPAAELRITTRGSTVTIGVDVPTPGELLPWAEDVHAAVSGDVVSGSVNGVRVLVQAVGRA